MSFGRFKEDSNASKAQVADSSKDNLTSGFGPGREAFISKGSKITGNISFTGPAEIDGQVDGEVSAQDRLSVGESAVVNAKITGAEVTIKGVVNGDIVASKRLILKKSAKVFGCISTPLLSVEEGVVFEGKVSMPSLTKSVDSKPGTVDSKVGSTAVDGKSEAKLVPNKTAGLF